MYFCICLLLASGPGHESDAGISFGHLLLRPGEAEPDQASAGPRRAADNTNVNASPKQQEDDRWGDNIVLAAATLPAAPPAPAAPAAPLDPGSGEPQPGAVLPRETRH